MIGKLRPVDRDLIALGDNVKIYAFRGLFILEVKVPITTDIGYIPKFKTELLFLGNKDLDRLFDYFNGLSKLALYFGLNSTLELNEEKYNSYIKMVRLLHKSIDKAKNKNSICRAFDVAFNYFLANLASDVNDTALNLQHAKFYAEKLDKILDLNEYMAILNATTISHAFEIAKIHKVLPACDYKCYGALNNWDRL